MKKPRILILTIAWRPVESGGEIAPRKIAEALSDECEFDVLAYRFAREHPKEEKTSYGTIYRIGGFGHAHWKKNLFTFFGVRKALALHKKHPYDAIWVVMASYAAGPAFFFNLFHHEVPILLTLQEGDTAEHIYRRLGVLRPFWHSFFRRVSGVQAISEYLARFSLEAGFRGKPTVIPNGVDVERFARPYSLPPPHIPLDGPVILITTGRLVEKNGVDTIIRALPYLPERVIFMSVGGGEEKEKFETLARELGIERRVGFVGQMPVEKIPHYLHRAHIFVRPSRSEGLGSSFLEAMAAGLPVVGTSVGGIPDFLKDGETGLFCKVDNPESLAYAVLRLIKEPALYSHISETGKRLVHERCDWGVISSRMQKEFFQLIVRKHGEEVGLL